MLYVYYNVKKKHDIEHVAFNINVVKSWGEVKENNKKRNLWGNYPEADRFVKLMKKYFLNGTTKLNISIPHIVPSWKE